MARQRVLRKVKSPAKIDNSRMNIATSEHHQIPMRSPKTMIYTLTECQGTILYTGEV